MYPGVEFSNAPYTMPAGTTYAAQVGVLTASRTVTLPAASTVANGTVVIVKDESGTATSTNTILVARAGADTINGGTASLTIDGSNGAYVRLVSNGTNAWTGSASLPVSKAGTGLPVKTGTAVLVAGTIAVADAQVTANTLVRACVKTAGGTVGAHFVSAKSAGVSFTLKSTSGTDTSTLYYEVISY